MGVREELITSAVSFLQDPTVSSSPVEKRVEFLKSKNLTQEEIDVALARASEDPSQTAPAASASTPYYPASQPSAYRRPPPQNYGQYAGYPDWQPPPPELPRRDWRDWFIMATVVGGASYGLYVLANRYIRPLIAPPTPPQLEQDKAAIDEQFNRAFTLLDTLSTDTAALKDAEEARTQRLDTALSDIESVVADLKVASQRREDENRRMEGDIRALKDSLPKAIDGVRDSSEKRLADLSKELSSLKVLMGNRFGTNPPPSSSTGMGMGARAPTIDANANARNEPKATDAPPSKPWSPSYMPSAPMATASRASNSNAGAGSKASIPAWQMAAANKNLPATNGASTGPEEATQSATS